MTSDLFPFTYPIRPHVRKHGPSGYKNYESYRDWLRDEFSFRCVFCLNREQWGVGLGVWDIDHLMPRSLFPLGECLYENLLYACRQCNLNKNDHLAPDPCQIAFGDCLVVHDDGAINALNEAGELLIKNLRLNNQDYTRFRQLIIQAIRSFFLHDRDTYMQWMRYPQNLPDLSRLKPPSNAKPEGVNDSFHACRLRGELSETY
jgi:hypothetical protein